LEKRYEIRNITQERLHHNTMTDLLNNLLISLDPLISSLRKLYQKCKIPHWNEAKQLLISQNEEAEDFECEKQTK
jgi:uncharacterized membrane protein affecting hemolysin expression